MAIVAKHIKPHSMASPHSLLCLRQSPLIQISANAPWKTPATHGEPGMDFRLLPLANCGCCRHYGKEPVGGRYVFSPFAFSN